MDTESTEITESEGSEDSIRDYVHTPKFRHSGEWMAWKASAAGCKAEEEIANKKKLLKEERANKRKLAELEKKYRIDPEVVIEITIDQLPKNLKMKDLTAYLSQTYPNKYVKIYHSPLTQHGPFLPEIISNILKQDSRYLPSATRISKAVRDKAMISYLDIECEQPILRKELLNYLDSRGIVMIVETNEHGIETFWYRMAEGTTVTTYDRTELDWKRMEEYKSVGRIHVITRNRLISIKDISMNVDMFAEYDILTHRKKCIELDKDFALKKLIQRYNNTIAKELNDELTEEDAERVFYMAELADGLGLARGVSMTKDVMINLSDQKKSRKILEPIFTHVRYTIKRELVSRYNLKVSPNNKFILTL